MITENAVVRIPMSDGTEVLVDAADAHLVAGLRWRPLRRPRATYAQAKHRGRTVLMHRLICGAGPDEEVDHANRNGIDNRRCNLRRCSKSQNQGNSVKRRGASRWKGVYWRPAKRRWVAEVRVGGVARSRLCRTEEEAARAYDSLAVAAFGEFARTNFPQTVGAV